MFYQAVRQPRGYEFFLDSQSIGAVQVLPLKQRFVWIRDGLDDEMKGVVATAAVSILLKEY